MTQARFIGGVDLDALLDPDAGAWRGVRTERVALMGTPLGLQPTDAIRVSWAQRKIGAVARVDLAALHNGSALAFRMEWRDPDENRELRDTTAFPDAAAVVLPTTPQAPLVTMGEPGAAVNAWYWRADEDTGRNVVAEGIGTSRTVDRELVRARGFWKEGRWRVVIARPLRIRTSEPVAQLEAGETTRFGVAVWEGGHRERAGIKAFSGDWRPLVLAGAPRARR